MSRVLRWRYDPHLDRVAFKVYEPGQEATASVRLMTGAELIALASSEDGRHRVLQALRRIVESRMVVARESDADPALLAVLGLD